MEKHNELPAQRKCDDYEYTTVDGFAQKYGFSRNEAIGQIKWFLCATGRESLWESEKIYIQRSEGRMMVFTPDDIAKYESIIATEKAHKPATQGTKKPLPEGMKKIGDMGTFKTFVNEALKLKTGVSGTDFLKHIRDCFKDKSKYSFLKEVTNIQYNDKKQFVCFPCKISEEYPEGLHWYSKKQVTDMWSHLKNNPPEK